MSSATQRISAAGDNFYDFQFVALLQLAFGKFRRRNGVSVMFYNDASGQ